MLEHTLPVKLSQPDLGSILVAQDTETSKQLPLPKSPAPVQPKQSDTDVEPNKPIDRTSALATHALCVDLLVTYVDDIGLVDYKMLRRKRLELIGVLNEYSNVKTEIYNKWSHNDQLAFWINTYNLCMIKAVVDNYPIVASRFKVIFYPANSIMQIDGVWDKILFNIMGENYSLTEIEQKILRSQFDDPRVSLAISYASMGSPPLRREPYTGAKLDQQFDDQARRFLLTDKGFKVDRDEPALYLSPVFDWYSQQFQAKYPAGKQFSDKSQGQASILTYISKHVSQKDTEWLARKIYPVKWIRFDWALNEQH